MNKREKLAYFKELHLLNKNELITNLEAYVNFYRDPNNDDNCSQTRKMIVADLTEKFTDEVKKMNLPMIVDDWWFYNFNFKFDSINLELMHSDEDDLTYFSAITLLTVKSDYLTIWQYAEKYHVAPSTVRQWLRRGKIRSAKKIGRSWLIPELTDKPKRGYVNVNYTWSYLSCDVIKRFPILEGFDEIYIRQDDYDNAVFHCTIHNSISDFSGEFELNEPERAKLEVALLSTNAVEAADYTLDIKWESGIK